ncbi:MAG: hypothetical protein V4550_02370 [Gemmatimonadota bacterium]
MRFLILLLAVSLSASAQQTVPKRYLAEDLRIESTILNKKWLWPVGSILLGPDGRTIVGKKNSNTLKAYDSAGKPLAWELKAEYNDRSEIGWIERIGWVGDKLWVSDGWFKQVVILDRDAKIINNIPDPTWVHPKWADRRKYPLFGSMQTIAVYPDSTKLVIPLSPRTLFDTPGFNRKVSHLLRVDNGGAVRKDVAQFDDDDRGRLTLRNGRATPHTMIVPYHAQRFWSVTPDGKRITFVEPAVSATDSGNVRVVALNENGDTIYARRYPMPVVRITQMARDSAIKSRNGYGEQTAEQVHAELAKRTPFFKTFLTNALIGNDYSTWIFLRPVSDSAQTQEALVLDERGEPIARLEIPANFTPLTVNRSHLWGVDKKTPGLVRFKVQDKAPPPMPKPVPPPRTATASKGKG